MKENSNIKNLVLEILKNSIAESWEEAKLEWKCVGVIENTSGQCICGHLLNNLYFIQNNNNEKRLIVGSSCVKKFGTKQMIDYVKNAEKLRKDYEKLIEKQKENKIPLSVRKPFLDKLFNLNIINRYEYKFYTNIYTDLDLTEKQFNFKKQLNQKMLNWYNANKK
jgi:hypothetical protein